MFEFFFVRMHVRIIKVMLLHTALVTAGLLLGHPLPVVAVEEENTDATSVFKQTNPEVLSAENRPHRFIKDSKTHRFQQPRLRSGIQTFKSAEHYLGKKHTLTEKHPLIRDPLQHRFSTEKPTTEAVVPERVIKRVRRFSYYVFEDQPLMDYGSFVEPQPVEDYFYLKIKTLEERLDQLEAKIADLTQSEPPS